MKNHRPLHKRVNNNKKHIPKTASLEHKKLYFSKEWKDLRRIHLDKFPFCFECGSTEKLHVDHVVAHKGDYRLFLDQSNLRTLCLRHHSSKTATIDQIRDESGRFM